MKKKGGKEKKVKNSFFFCKEGVVVPVPLGVPRAQEILGSARP